MENYSGWLIRDADQNVLERAENRETAMQVGQRLADESGQALVVWSTVYRAGNIVRPR